MADSSNFKILFVDNSRTTRATMARIFKKHGYEVETVGTGQEAIDMVKTGGFNLVVMDLYMPQMNGYEAAKVIRELPEDRLKNIPIIALTASNNQKDVAISEDAGMNDFVVKSSDHQALFDTLNKYKK